ncbi:SUR7/PalI family-domain-containing protein [Dioszegia hungarica]|uniref:SUR7/PalI family-domain-containing protein n=1 Tax=Dioszegia hungarica TaxID=4972 RepID=A0AA38H266_9TREE|nr:SUR7/PalI family-domain-containing protein [Dioszegia hungarica]KAI9632738.1 SUR7/PalI family-domain-containing protein [Dioszegia hungarica]
MLAPAAFPALFFTASGFILLLLVTLSVPYTKTIYLLSITGPGASGNVRLGVFGACYEGGNAEFLGYSYSGFSRCTPATVGYDLDARFFGTGSNANGAQVVAKTLAGALVLNPIAAGFAGISFIFALLAWLASSRVAEILCFLTLFFTSLAAWVAFALDISIALVARKRVEDYTRDVFDARLGAGVWLALAAAILLTLAICAAGCGSFGRYSEKYRSSHDASPGMTVVGEKPKRRFPWQSKTTYRGTY